ncbi:hypothetical protein B0H13DRAFT_2065594 [Mycena leptocephala]|nr:hypothetical protein B0H13DRAFT_2065594 [Mycena leptocephala]
MLSIALRMSCTVLAYPCINSRPVGFTLFPTSLWLFPVGCPSWSPLMCRFTLVSCLLFRVPHSLARSPGIRCRTPLGRDGRLAHLTV